MVVQGPSKKSEENASPTPTKGPVAPGKVRVVGAPEYRPSTGFPDAKTAAPDVWRTFFADSKPGVWAVKQHVLYLTDKQEHEHVIALLNAAIIEGQAQPWMYEVLAVTMKAAKYPEAEIERVVLSVADFGNATFDSMMYSAAYLSQLGHHAAAIRMYRQAARMSPERPEPYTLSMKLARQTAVADDAIWAACGVLRNAWGVDFPRLHERAEDLLAETAKTLKLEKQADQLARLESEAAEARRRDMEVKIQWNGTGDLDLSVEDPAGSIASFETRESAGGGYLLNDGFGSSPENCHEDFVCPFGFTGEYVIRVKRSSGKIVGNRAVLTIVTHVGSAAEKKTTKTIQLDEDNEQVLRVTLEDGRREERRVASFIATPGVARDWERAAAEVGQPKRRMLDPEARRAVAEMRKSRQQAGAQGGDGGGFGAIGFAPVVRVIPEGASLAVQAVVSPDRRYVRMALSPSFTQIIDVAVFSFQGGSSGNTSR